ncbi:hypothetical protein Aple_069990 [Acrocarpospora pleiomorpha]|uniref:FIMAH domain-containing protein n=1 Tax=Acrocarpospora pleiomorpha TaxID=90975 RepID=A0A5M3XTD2_9ACTN|nr:hypothetical protein [Acrocarpospora pleiomorpha]GES24100.1 hypothetical protein Aple_069990 [Acrocarpospora pleiomorpha]
MGVGQSVLLEGFQEHRDRPRGNETIESVTFDASTSSTDLAALVDRFTVAGRLSQKAAAKLHDRIRKLIDAEADGKTPKILKALNRLREETADVELVPDAEVRDILTRDVDELLDRLPGGQG